MGRFKAGQKVYFYQITGEYVGTIIEGTIKKIVKDLSTGEVTYSLDIPSHPLWLWNYNTEHLVELREENLYSSRKKIEKEYKDEIVYNNLKEKIDRLQSILLDVRTELQKDEHKDFTGMTLNITGEKAFSTICLNSDDVVISGIGSIKEKVEELEKEVKSIKKKIKPKTKKPIVKKEEKKEEPTPKFTLDEGE